MKNAARCKSHSLLWIFFWGGTTITLQTLREAIRCFFYEGSLDTNLTFSSHYSASSERACSKPHSASCFHLSLIRRPPVRLCVGVKALMVIRFVKTEHLQSRYKAILQKPRLCSIILHYCMKEAGEGRPSETAADKCGNNKDGRTRCDFNEVLYLVDFFFLIEEKKPQTCFFFLLLLCSNSPI